MQDAPSKTSAAVVTNDEVGTPCSEPRRRVAIHGVRGDAHVAAAVDRLRTLASASGGCSSYELREDPDTADLVLWVARPDGDFLMREIQADPAYVRLRDRCVVFSEAANPAPMCPGLYTGVDRKYAKSGWVGFGPYVQKMRASELPDDGLGEPIEHLYSFVGSGYTHPVRERILAIDDPRALLQDTGDASTAFRLTHEASEDARRERRVTFDRCLARSSFVLCPRGRSAGAIRFYETLRAGRAPVVLSDQMGLPDGPPWDDFVVRVAESDVATLPSLLRSLESEAVERGRVARQVWDDWFADDVLFGRLVGWAQAVQASRRDSAAARVWRRRLLLQPQPLRIMARGWLKRRRST